MTTDLAEPTATRTTWWPPPTLVLVPIAAVAWWVGGFLPWLLEGLGHGLGLPTMAVPLIPGRVTTLVVGSGLGGVLAGLTARLGTGSPVVRVGASAAGVALAMAMALPQSRSSITVGVDERITNGLTWLAILTTLVGLALGLLGLTRRLGLGLAVAVLAGATPVWVMSTLNAAGLSDGGQLQGAQDLSRWAGAVVLAVALVAIGIQPLHRVAAWVAVVVLAWFVAPTVTAVGYMEVFLRPGMGLPDMWSEHLSATMDVWRMAASLEARPLTPWIVAIAAAIGVSAWLARRPPPDAREPAQ